MGQIEIKRGFITGVAEGTKSFKPDIVLPDDYMILPGFIDIHVHAREYPLPEDHTDEEARIHAYQTSKETFKTVSSAAINGGVTAFGLMPNDPIPPKCLESYTDKQIAGLHDCFIDHFMYALVTNRSEPFGDYPYKLYTHDFTNKEISDIFKRYRGQSYNPRLFVHCEDKTTVDKYCDRPEVAEVKSIDRILNLSSECKVPVHIVHVSTFQGIEMISDAKRAGVDVTCETSPAYCIFSKENMWKYKNHRFFSVKPPIRPEKSRQRILEALITGEIDCIATDHAPHLLEDKRKKKPISGMPHLDNYVHTIGWLLQHGLPLSRLVESACIFPGKVIQRYGVPDEEDGELVCQRYGDIRKGYVGSLTIVKKDLPGRLYTEREFPIKTKCGWSPYEAAKLGNKYLLTAPFVVVRGVLYKNIEEGDGFDEKRSAVLR